MLPILRLKKNEDRRLRAGHLWIYSNEIDTHVSPLKHFTPGQEVLIEASNQTPLGIGYVNPNSLITARILTRNIHEKIDLTFFIERFQRALTFRSRFFSKPFYRLVFGESDFLPGLVIDRFDEHLVVQINTAGMDVKQDIIVNALRHLLPETKSILLRNDGSQRKQEGLEPYVRAAFSEPPEKMLMEENDVAFSIPLWQGQKTGWFYDHRANRLRLKDYVKNQRVLDVFSYLGAWGISAAKWGADSVTCVDSSSLSHHFIQENARLNNVEKKITIIEDDAFSALKQLAEEKQLFSLIVLDPPAFIKKQKDKKEGVIAYQRINELALKLLAVDGILISCSCSMHMSDEELVQVLRRSSFNTQSPLQIIERGHQAQDHPVHLAIPETDYLKMIIARKTE